jgi:hypothetical protein
LIDLQPTVLMAPAVIRVFDDAERSTRLGHRLPFAQRDLGFPQLGEDLFDGCDGNVAYGPPFGPTLT